MDDSQNTAVNSELWSQANGVESANVEEEGEALSLKIASFVRLCRARPRMFIGIFVAGILIALLYALIQPNVYTSTTTLMPPDNSSPYSNIMSMLSSGGSAASFGSEALGLNTPGALFVSILGSRAVQDGLINRFDLIHYYEAKLPEDARKSLAANTSITEDRKSGIIAISVRAMDPVLASNLAQGYVLELNRVVTDDSTSSARRERVFLEGRLKDIKQNLDDSAKALSQFSSKSGTIDIPSQAKSMVEAGLKLQTELIDGRSELAALRQTFSENNARVRSVEARNAELQKQIDAMGGLSSNSGSNADASKSGYPSAQELPALGVTYYDLDRRMKVDEALWEALTKQYEVAKVDEAKQIPTVRVLDVANVPQRKSAPVRWLIMVIGALFSLIAACVLVPVVTAWEEMDPQDEPKRLLGELLGRTLSSRQPL